ncbi:hypothetical protein GIB67_017391 [Kingdonia uniflora]|uniref:Uncharacterized protein n=1 Tax=Kingdonia uniflora TaxID=39325 RepID=A0A7J7M4G6_9MAGN|nr:hypothetical protein GIB67_017391 [Kingdonia uniflora]
MYTLRRPPKHYEDFVCFHFLERAHVILEVGKAYAEGADIGFLGGKSGTLKLQKELSDILPRLVESFTRNGAKEC